MCKQRIGVSTLNKEYLKHHKVVKQWCSECDCNEVDPYDEKTGLFFVQSGQDIENDDYVTIVWAICIGCLA